MDPETRRNIQAARRLTSGLLPVEVSWQAVAGLGLRVAVDRGYEIDERFSVTTVPDFFALSTSEAFEVDLDPAEVVAWLEEKDRHNAVYLELLVRLLARRLKYRAILRTQAFAVSEQVGPRTLLEHGFLDSGALAAIVVWRKWLMDIDNRAGQETGYLYDAVVARALGGRAYGAGNSPVKRTSGTGARQVDCVVEDPPNQYAYEVKIRVTDAASRQGRLNEELSFPEDCASSGYVPRLLVFDATPCTTLDALVEAFENSGGGVYLGPRAYDHIRATAGSAQAEFLRRYVAEPLKGYEDTMPDGEKGRALAGLRLSATPDLVELVVDGYSPYVIKRDTNPATVLSDEKYDEGAD